ncbi:DUF4241 domain-containing protein [Nocardiopsis sp. RSe5-2]|uniref:DUF4241 domain-containing protein n=1 Tax=Nocardiopsis endophytica TaxID=3018445 RepID=A0ABT4U1P7_9ACTN|nr:DUF4241 domain-containing protein [Nocardiopsis endophytica]MDA2810282.1 DUF4241 domain-containing protein [Nocardiopsis endophytica]
MSDRTTAGAAPTPAPRRPEAFFTGGRRFRHEDIKGEAFTTEVLPRGELVFPTGRLIAGDPTGVEFPEDYAPYVQEIPPGRYPLHIVVARRDGEEGEPEGNRGARVCAAVLMLRDEPVAEWEMALLPGEDPADLAVGEEEDEDFIFFGFGVDGGMGCFFDASLLDHFSGMLADDDPAPEAPSWITLLCGGGPYPRVQGTDTVTLEAPDGTPGLTAFETGFGDGAYPVWFGRTTDGEVAAVVADFLILYDAVPEGRG